MAGASGYQSAPPPPPVPKRSSAADLSSLLEQGNAHKKGDLRRQSSGSSFYSGSNVDSEHNQPDQDNIFAESQSEKTPTAPTMKTTIHVTGKPLA